MAHGDKRHQDKRHQDKGHQDKGHQVAHGDKGNQDVTVGSLRDVSLLGLIPPVGLRRRRRADQRTL